jgi:glucose/arabinose dehydrogenase
MGIKAIAFALLALSAVLSPVAGGTTAVGRHEQLLSTSAAINLQPVLSGLNSPLYLTNAHDGSGRLFILEQPGRIKVLQRGAAVPSVFLDITSRVLSGGERGLLGLAFHPQFSANGRFLVDYTRRPDGATVIAEYQVSANADVADPAEKVLLVIQQPFANHNGGMVEFGPDGFLYIGMGDGGSANDPGNRAQNVDELLGKILRIDVDHPSGSQAYSSPPDNPFHGDIPGRDEIFAFGLRNPWRFSFDRLTGQLYVGDVGQDVIEEVDIVTLGGNYGWRVLEGDRCTGNDPAKCGAGGFTAPIAEYSHTGGRCSITGGYVYRGSKSSLPFGSFVYADYCSGEIFLLENGSSSLLTASSLNVSSFGEDEQGEIYVVGLGGTIDRIENPNPPPFTPFSITGAIVRRRSTGELMQPVSVRSNGKKFELVIAESASAPVQASAGATVLVNGVELKTKYTTTDVGTPVFVARLKRDMLAEPGVLTIEVVRLDGTPSNELTLQVVQ